MSANYTEAEETRLSEVYQENPSPDTVEELSQELGKSKNSIIAKLSAMGVYVKQEAGKKRQRKKEDISESIRSIAQDRGAHNTVLVGLENANRTTLLQIEELLLDQAEQ